MCCLAAEHQNLFTLNNVYKEFVKKFCATKKKGPFPKIMCNVW